MEMTSGYLRHVPTLVLGLYLLHQILFVFILSRPIQVTFNMRTLGKAKERTSLRNHNP